jgi:hypothetical protein
MKVLFLLLCFLTISCSRIALDPVSAFVQYNTDFHYESLGNSFF